MLYTFGNASGVDREKGLIAIKPSGVPYEQMKAEDLVVTDLDGTIVEGTLNPSSDLATHAFLYRSFPTIGGVVHTHSEFATAWAQAQKAIPCFGTTHADYFNGAVPVTEPLTDEEIEGEYELNTGVVILRRFRNLDPEAVPGVLVAGHAPFTWGKTPEEAAHTAVVLEYLAKLAFRASLLRKGLVRFRRHYCGVTTNASTARRQLMASAEQKMWIKQGRHASMDGNGLRVG